MMIPLNLPEAKLTLRTEGQNTQIFDSFRKKYVVLTPEEWVRQNLLSFLVAHRNFPASLIAVEMELSVGRLQKRCDGLVYDRNGKPIMLIECKAASVKISQDVFDQIARYNLTAHVKYLLISNGLDHRMVKLNETWTGYDFLKDIPEYQDLV